MAIPQETRKTGPVKKPAATATATATATASASAAAFGQAGDVRLRASHQNGGSAGEHDQASRPQEAQPKAPHSGPPPMAAAPPPWTPRGVALVLLRILFVVTAPLLNVALSIGHAVVGAVRAASANPRLAPFVDPALDVLADFVTYHRGVFVTLCLNPVSRAWELADILRDWMWAQQMPAAGDASARRALHAQRIAHVQRQVRDLVAAGATRLCTARPGYLAMSLKAGVYKKKWAGVDVHALRDVVELDEAREVVRVEPGCNMGRLSRDLLARGWTLVVVPELDELTVGGLVNGFGVETSSHKYGLFQHICTAFELVMPNGDYIVCDAERQPDLFAAVPWSHGTLGFLVGAELRVRRAAQYVRLQYLPCHSRAEGIRVFEAASRDNSNDFVESLAYSPEKSVVMVGKLADRAGHDGSVNAIGKWHKPWFFTHVQSFLDTPAPGADAANAMQARDFVEYIPLRDYYHRHTRALFWEMRDIVPFGNQAWYRWLCAWAGPPKVAIMKATTTGKLKVLWETKHVAQDLLVPMATLADALDQMDAELGVYPLWLCPMRMLSPPENLLALRGAHPAHPALQATKPAFAPLPVTTPAGSLTPPHPADQLYVDVGAYGVPKAPAFHHIKTLERLEQWVRDVQGYQALYADTTMDRAQFRDMFDHRNYDKVRAKHNAGERLPEIWEKVNQSARA